MKIIRFNPNPWTCVLSLVGLSMLLGGLIIGLNAGTEIRQLKETIAQLEYQVLNCKMSACLDSLKGGTE